MKFRTKLLYCFITLGAVSTLLALFIIYSEASRIIFNEVRGKILSLVVGGRELINKGDLEGFIKGGEDVYGEPYSNLQEQLGAITQLSKHTDTYVQFAYIIRKHRGSDGYYYIVNAKGSGHPPITSYGDAYPSPIEIPDGKFHSYVTKRSFSNKEGTWLTGYSPLYGSDGELLGFLGLDVQTEGIAIMLERLFLYGLMAFGISLIAAFIFAYLLSKRVSSSLRSLCKTVATIGEGELSCRSHLQTRDEFNQLAIAINDMARGLQERERLKTGVKRYVSKYALDDLLQLDKPLKIEGERKKVTILFSDIRGFTTLAEKYPPETILAQLNEYFQNMIDVIFEYGGTLDKFMGDGMMVEFGAPLEDHEQELHAVLAAIHMHLKLAELTKKWNDEGKPMLEMGIGIHTGMAVVGNIGSEKRMEYTAIGDAVNVASRLERVTKKIKKPIIVSDEIYKKTKDQFVFEDLDEVELQGREGVIKAYAMDPHAQKL